MTPVDNADGFEANQHFPEELNEMKNRIFLASILIGSMVFGSATLFAQDAIDGHGSQEPPMAGVHWAKGENNGQGNGQPDGNGNGNAGFGGGGVKLLQYHGGPVQHGTSVTPIFWGPGWSTPGDKIVGLTAFYNGVGGSSYAATNTEYTDGSGHVSSLVALNGTFIDSSDVTASGQSTSAIQSEVCKMISNPVPGGYYPVYIDQARGSAGFCAWHSAGTCSGVNIQFGFFFKLDGDPGCDPGGQTGSYNGTATNSQGLAALANVSGHELSEMLTDPKLNAWYDRMGSENSDKCAWTFGSSLLNFPGGSSWKIQGNWSNAAYSGGTGYVRGCIDGN
jgi:hypothetical protein